MTVEFWVHRTTSKTGDRSRGVGCSVLAYHSMSLFMNILYLVVFLLLSYDGLITSIGGQESAWERRASSRGGLIEGCSDFSHLHIRARRPPPH